MKKNIILFSVILFTNFIFSKSNSLVPPTVTATFTPSICDGSVTDIVLNSDTTNTTYTWFSTIANISNYIPAGSGYSISNQIVNLSNSQINGSINLIVIPTANGIDGNPINIMITVNPIPVAIPAPNLHICNNEFADIYLASTIPGTYYTWTSTSSNLIGPSSGSGNSISQILSLIDNNTAGFVEYYVTPSINGCNGSPEIFTVIVAPTPNTGSEGEISVSEALTTPIDLFSIISGEEPGGNWNRTSGTGGTFNSVIGTFTPEVGATNSTFSYELTNSDTGCYSSTLATINIDEIPIGLANTTNQTISNNDFSNIILSSTNVPSSNFTWTFTANNISGASNGSGTTIAQQLSLIDTNSNGYVDYFITPINNTAIGTTFSARVNIQSTLNSETFVIDNLKLNPNPVIDILNIESNNTIRSIRIYNQLGQIVYIKKINNNNTKIDLSSISPGFYNIILETDNKIINKKVIKQ